MTFALHWKPSCNSESCVWGVVSHDVLGGPYGSPSRLGLPMAFFREAIVPAISNVLESPLQLWIFFFLNSCVLYYLQGFWPCHASPDLWTSLHLPFQSEGSLPDFTRFAFCVPEDPASRRECQCFWGFRMAEYGETSYDVPCATAIRISLLKVSAPLLAPVVSENLAQSWRHRCHHLCVFLPWNFLHLINYLSFRFSLIQCLRGGWTICGHDFVCVCTRAWI